MKKRIAFFQNELTMGGIQKSLINLLTGFDYDNCEVDLYLFTHNDFWDVEFPKELHVKYLKPVSKLLSFVPFSWAKKLIKPDFSDCEEYDLAIDFNSYQNCCAVGAIKVPAKKRVMWIHNDVEIKLNNEWKYRVLWNFFKGKFAYYDKFVAVSDGLRKPFSKMSGIPEEKICAIQNAINVKEIRERINEEPEGFCVDPSCFNLVAVGRICHQKGYDIMLDTLNEALKEREDLRLYILGDGPDRPAIEAQIKRLGLSDKVTLLGNQQNPFCYMKHMDAFISTSRYEGQPLNIMEAMAVGLPLYCAKNLEKYLPTLNGIEDIAAALKAAVKEEKKPDDLIAYNTEILNSVIGLCD